MSDTTSIVLDELGDLDAAPGSRVWAIAVRLEIQSLLKDAESSAKHLQTWLKLMEQHAGYRQLTDGKGRSFSSYRAFCQARPPFGLGYDTEVIDRIVSERESAQGRQEALEGKTINSGDGRLTTEELSNPSIIRVTDTGYGTTSEYLSRRIKRDFPVIHQKMLDGQYKSVRQAALEAGIVKPTVTVPIEPDAIARAIIRHFDRAQVSEIVRMLVEATVKEG